jgi:hypothetical protein
VKDGEFEHVRSKFMVDVPAYRVVLDIKFVDGKHIEIQHVIFVHFLQVLRLNTDHSANWFNVFT